MPPLQDTFPWVLQIYISFFSKITPLASGVCLKTRFENGPGALADSYAVENPNIDFEGLSHTSQRTKSCLHPSRRCVIIALPEVIVIYKEKHYRLCYNIIVVIYLYSLWGYVYNNNLFGAQCIVFRLGIIAMMKRILGSMIRIIGKIFENTRIE